MKGNKVCQNTRRKGGQVGIRNPENLHPRGSKLIVTTQYNNPSAVNVREEILKNVGKVNGGASSVMTDELGHIAKDCPNHSSQRNIVGQFFTLGAKKARGDTNLVTNTCYVNNQPLFVLVERGSTHSFISTKCVQQLRFEATFLPSPIVITSTTNNIDEAQWVCRDCFISFNGREFLIDLISYHSRRLP